MSFTYVQGSAAASGAGSVSASFPSAAGSSPNTLLVATLFNAGGVSFTPPANAGNAGWQLAKSVPFSGGQLEQWYWANNPGGLYPNGTPAVFTGSGACRGAITEYASPAGTQQVLQTVGYSNGTGYGTAMPVSTASGVFAGTLAVLSLVEPWSGGNVSGNNLITPTGFTYRVGPATGVAVSWAHEDNLNCASGTQGGTPGFTYNGGGAAITNGWAVALSCFRSVSVSPINFSGAEVTNCLTLDPTGQIMAVGGDVDGYFTSANFGDNWQPALYGIEAAGQQSFAFTAFSLMGGTETGNLYAGGGHTAGDGAFLVSTDGGCTWQARSTTTIWWYGNATPSPPRPNSHPPDKDRSVGRLLAQDAAGGFLYNATGNLGVARSADFGVTWKTISASIGNASTFWPRCVVLNPLNNQQVFAGGWDTGNGLGGVWTTTSAQAANPSWTQLGGYQGTVSDLKILGDFLYATCDTSGIARAQISTGGNLNAINGSFVDTSGASYWTGLDGYIDGSGDHVIVAGCSFGQVPSGANLNYTQVVSLLLPGASTSGIVYSDLCNSNPGTQTIDRQDFPPFSLPWWKPNSNWGSWLGGNQGGNIHVLINPFNTNQIFVTGTGGFFRSNDGGNTWKMPINGMPLIKFNSVAIDPLHPSHFVGAGADYTGFDFLDPTGNTLISDANPPLSGLESHALDFDPVDGRLFFGQNKKYATDTNGGIWFRKSGSSAWSAEMGFSASAVGNGHAPMGMIAGRDGSNNPYFVVVANTLGTYRWTQVGTATSWVKCTENDSAPLLGSGGTLSGRVPFVPFAQGNSPAYLYAWDNPNGLYRSTDYGQSWTQVWTTAAGNQIAVNPNTGGEVWAAGNNNLYKISGANSGVVGQSGGPVVIPQGGVFSSGCGGVAFAANGAVFATAIGGSNPSPPVTTLYVSYNGGASWAPVCGGDGSDASYGAPAGQLYISPDNFMWSTAGTHVGWWNQVLTATGTAALSGSGTLTATASGQRGTTALSGQGTLTANGNTAQSASLSGHGTLAANSTIATTVHGIAMLSGSGSMTALPSLITSVSVVPPYVPGQLILISDAGDWWNWNITYKTVSTPRSSTTTVTADPDLSADIEAGASYEVRGTVFYDGPSSVGILFNFGYPSDTTFTNSHWRYLNGSVNPGSDPGNKTENADTNSSATNKEVLVFHGNLQAGVTAGTLAFQWAQLNSNGTPLNVLANSFMMMRRVA